MRAMRAHHTLNPSAARYLSEKFSQRGGAYV
jgi:hypothetical protein